MDELKKHIQLHRTELDTDVPAARDWSNAEKKRKPVIRNLYRRWVAAASVVLAIGALAYFFPAKNTEKSISTVHVLHRWDITINKTEKNTPPVAVIVDKQKQSATSRATTAKKKKKQVPIYGFEGIEASYAAMLNMQRERLRMQPIYGENADYFDLFKNQFVTLNKEEERIKEQVKKTGLQDTHLDELISIYQEKVNVLKQLQFEINRINTRYKQADPDINKRPASYINL
jgi:hypothetical protein